MVKEVFSPSVINLHLYQLPRFSTHQMSENALKMLIIRVNVAVKNNYPKLSGIKRKLLKCSALWILLTQQNSGRLVPDDDTAFPEIPAFRVEHLWITLAHGVCFWNAFSETHQSNSQLRPFEHSSQWCHAQSKPLVAHSVELLLTDHKFLHGT